MQTTRALQLAGVIGLEENRAVWTGGNTTLVQLGDILDRGDEEIGACSAARCPFVCTPPPEVALTFAVQAYSSCCSVWPKARRRLAAQCTC